MTRARWMAPVAAMLLGGCAFVPKEYPRLTEAARQHEQVKDDARMQALAGTEMRLVQHTLDSAHTARNTLADAAEVDHLAYLAKQRLTIARLTAELGPRQ